MIAMALGCAGVGLQVRAETAPGPAILNTHSFWRCHVTLRPPLYGTASDARPDASGSKTLPAGQPWTEAPPSEWAQPDFDDRGWWREPAPFPGLHTGLHGSQWDPYGERHPPQVALLSIRGKFTVTDPAGVQALILSLTWRGGVVVYLNGQEVLRRHMSSSGSGVDALAEDYPADVLAPLPRRGVPDAQARRECRLREVREAALPVSALRKGVNVLAVQVHRSALAPTRKHHAPWGTCGLVAVDLRAEGSGAISNIARPGGQVQVWNAPIFSEVTDVDYGDPHDALDTVRIVGARNGFAAGQIVLSSDRPLRGIRASVSDLAHERTSARMSSERLRVFFPALSERSSNTNHRYPIREGKLTLRQASSEMKNAGGMRETPPDEVPVAVKTRMADGYPYVWGAVQPIWVQIDVPRDAEPGAYRGVLTVRADGLEETRVPLSLRISTWTLPDPGAFAFFTDMVQSPEGLAAHYGVPLWSERHFELIGQTFRMLGQVGNKTVYVPAITPTHFSNDETMIRWIEDGRGGYRHDFSLMERYLDVAEKHMGRPRVVCVYLWDVYLGGRAHAGGFHLTSSRAKGGMVDGKEDTVGVTRLDPATGKRDTIRVPVAGEEAKRIWKPFADELQALAKRRGLESALMLGLAGDVLPSKEQVLFWNALLPDAAWVVQGHGRQDEMYGVPVGYSSSVFGCSYAQRDPTIQRIYGWKREKITTNFPRYTRTGMSWNALAFSRLLPEWNISGNQNGIGRIPADFFGLKPGKYPGCSWQNASIKPASWLEPGVSGPYPTAEFLLCREGIQECEARIVLEKALTDEAARTRLGTELAERCQALLDERTRRIMWIFDSQYLNHNKGAYGILGQQTPLGLGWYAWSGWEDRGLALFDVAAEVEAALRRP